MSVDIHEERASAGHCERRWEVERDGKEPKPGGCADFASSSPEKNAARPFRLSQRALFEAEVYRPRRRRLALIFRHGPLVSFAVEDLPETCWAHSRKETPVVLAAYPTLDCLLPSCRLQAMLIHKEMFLLALPFWYKI
jgi:hypothetical protein